MPWNSELDSVIQRMVEAGLPDFFVRRQLMEAPKAADDGNNAFRVEHVLGIGMVWAAGIELSVVLFAAENVMKRPNTVGR